LNGASTLRRWLADRGASERATLARLWFLPAEVSRSPETLATGSYDGAWYVDVKHQDLSYHPASITGGTFRLDTFIGGWPAAITGAFVGGTVSQIGGFSGCTNQNYAVQGTLGGVGINGGVGSGSFSATLTHYRTNVWFVGCVIYAASVKGTVSLTF